MVANRPTNPNFVGRCLVEIMTRLGCATRDMEQSGLCSPVIGALRKPLGASPMSYRGATSESRRSSCPETGRCRG